MDIAVVAAATLTAAAPAASVAHTVSVATAVSTAITVYASIKTEAVNLTMLVDTGANTSCVTKKIYQDHREEFRRLESVDMIVILADRSALPIAGRTWIVTLVLRHSRC